MTKDSDNQIYTVKEVSNIMKIHSETVRRLCREGSLKAFKPLGHDWRIAGADLDEWVKKSKVKKPVIEEMSEFNSDYLQKIHQGESVMKKAIRVKDKTGQLLNRWITGFGGFFSRKDSNGYDRWMIWWRDENNVRKHKAVHLVASKEEALVALQFELEKERKKAFIKKYLPNQAEELAKELGIEEENNHTVRLEKMCDDWLENYAKLNKKNVGSDESVIRYWNERFGKKKAIELTKGDIIRHFAEEQKSALKEDKDVEKIKATQHQRGAVLRSIFNWAINLGDYGIKENPMEGTLPKVKQREKEPFKREDIQKLFKKAKDLYPWMIPVLAYASVTGGRIGEISNLKWENVNLEEGWIKLVDTKEKRNKIVDIDPNCDLYKMFVDLKESQKSLDERDFKNGDHGYVFIYWNQRFEKWGRVPIQDHFLELRKLAGVNGKTFHTFRHSAGSIAIAAGANVKAVQAILGHSTVGMTAHYLHADREAKIKVVRTNEKQLNMRYLLNGEGNEFASLPQGN